MRLYDVEFGFWGLNTFKCFWSVFFWKRWLQRHRPSIQVYDRNVSAPFYGEVGFNINRAVYDFGIEGTTVAENDEGHGFNYSSILMCQDECNMEDRCVSCSYDYGASDENCTMYSAWIAGR
jgi:hypothetical protein